MNARNSRHSWPNLSRIDLQPTTDALHLFSQVVGKVRLMLTPWINQSWHATFYLSARGFTTGVIHTGAESFEMEFDLLDDMLRISVADGRSQRVPLGPQSVASFYNATMQALHELEIAVTIDPMPCEIPGAISFADDHAPRPYEAETARAYWRAMLQAHRTMQLFRSRFIGKCSPIHLFWGSFDLAVTRFSGRNAPPHPGGMPHVKNAVAREAYCQEVSSAGFWPGSGRGASFYSYAYPVPEGFGAAKVAPGGFDAELGEFILGYDAVQASPDPDNVLLQFLQTTYEAAADLAHWDRARLERPQGLFGRPPDGA
jgi:hypothetical protein